MGLPRRPQPEVLCIGFARSNPENSRITLDVLLTHLSRITEQFTEPTIRAMFDSSLDLLALENFTANISDDFHDTENLLAYQNFEDESDGEAAAVDAP